jgi:hypothetical protein
MASFTSIPVLSLVSAKEPSTKPKFLNDLRSALLNVGFCYLSDTGLPPELVRRVCDQTFAFFDEDVLPLAEKESIEMKQEKSFLGWSRVCTVSSSYWLYRHSSIHFVQLGLLCCASLNQRSIIQPSSRLLNFCFINIFNSLRITIPSYLNIKAFAIKGYATIQSGLSQTCRDIKCRRPPNYTTGDLSSYAKINKTI